MNRLSQLLGPALSLLHMPYRCFCAEICRAAHVSVSVESNINRKKTAGMRNVTVSMYVFVLVVRPGRNTLVDVVVGLEGTPILTKYLRVGGVVAVPPYRGKIQNV